MTNVANWITETTTTTGTGPITLSGPASGYASFAQGFGASPIDVYYAIENGDNKEEGVGQFNGTNTLTRTTPVTTLVAGVFDDSSPSPITLSGNSTVRCTLSAEAFRSIPAQNQTETIAGFIETPSDKTYKLVVKIPFAMTITETTTVSASGTCTATFKINTTALGGTANSVSSTEQSQSHSSANSVSVDDDIQVTISSNSSCADLSFIITGTRALD